MSKKVIVSVTEVFSRAVSVSVPDGVTEEEANAYALEKLQEAYENGFVTLDYDVDYCDAVYNVEPSDVVPAEHLETDIE